MKWSNPRERSSALGVVAIEKGAFWLPSTKVVNLTFFLIKKKSERSEKRKYTNTWRILKADTIKYAELKKKPQ